MRPERLIAVVCAALAIASPAAVAQTEQDDMRPAMTNPRSAGGLSHSANAPGESRQVPPTLTLPAGTPVTVRTTGLLSSDRNKPGDGFTAVLDQSLIAQGWVVARRGQVVTGRVVTTEKSGRSNPASRLGVELSELTLVDGQPLLIQTELVNVLNDKPSRGSNEGAVVGATTGTGAVIGAIAGGGPGAAIGAAIGAAAGVAGVLSTRGRPTEIYPEAQLTFRLLSPAVLSTEQSRHAFLPVTPGDYERGTTRNPGRYLPVRGHPVSSRPYFVPYDYDWYVRPYTYPGLYGYFGPRYYAGIRVYVGPGYRRYRR